jgi:putative glycosyltransferase (TIGR04372 family)
LKFFQIPSRIGHTAIAAEVLATEEFALKRSTRVVPYFTHPYSTNSYLKCLIRTKTNALSDRSSRPLNAIRKVLPNIFTNLSDDDIRLFEKRLVTSSPIYALPEKDQMRGASVLEQNGLDASAPWVALCVRDGAYVRKLNNLRDDDPGTVLRNSPIELFAEAAYALAKRGFFVFRMGRTVEKQLPVSHPNIIDYPYTNWSSDFMDIYLMARSRLVLSTSLGIDAVASLFRVPIAAINLSQMSYRANWICELPKLFVERETGRKLRLSEIIERGVHSAYSTGDFPEDLELANRSSAEIVAACLEAIAFVDSGQTALFAHEEKFDQNYEKIRERMNQPRIDGLKHRLSSVALSTQPDYLD